MVIDMIEGTLNTLPIITIISTVTQSESGLYDLVIRSKVRGLSCCAGVNEAADCNYFWCCPTAAAF